MVLFFSDGIIPTLGWQQRNWLTQLNFDMWALYRSLIFCAKYVWLASRSNQQPLDHEDESDHDAETDMMILSLKQRIQDLDFLLAKKDKDGERSTEEASTALKRAHAIEIAEFQHRHDAAKTSSDDTILKLSTELKDVRAKLETALHKLDNSDAALAKLQAELESTKGSLAR